jgi:CRP/FNR family transcriptional regulator
VHTESDLAFLGALPYFRGLSPAELAEIGRNSRRRSLENGAIILLEGASTDGLYVVRGGSVRVYKSSPGGREQVLIVLEAGDTFNDVPVFDGGPNPASAQAAAPGTIVCEISAAYIRHLLATNPQVSANVVRVLAARLRHLTSLVEDLSLRHIVQRVAKLLLEEYAPDGAGLTLTQQEMASRVGAAREVVSRALRELERHGAITRQHNRIVRIDPQRLSALIAQTTPADI